LLKAMQPKTHNPSNPIPTYITQLERPRRSARRHAKLWVWKKWHWRAAYAASFRSKQESSCPLLPVSSLASSCDIKARSPTTHTVPSRHILPTYPQPHSIFSGTAHRHSLDRTRPAQPVPAPTQSKPWPPRFTDGAAGASLPCSNAPPRAPPRLPPPFPPCPRRRGRPLPPLWP
jgi:hypothetical protein